MRCYPEGGEFQPLFVCGLPRCGTRFIADALNLSEEVTINGEVQTSVVETMVDLLSGLDGYYETRKRGAEWQARKQHLMTVLWEMASRPTRISSAKGSRYVGFKNPHHDRFFAFYEELFRDPAPLWIFCVRNFRDYYRSIASMPWRKNGMDSLEYIATEYIDSLERLARMRAKAPTRVIPFVLDVLIENSESYLSVVADQIGVQADDELVCQMVALGNRNSSVSKGVNQVEISEDEDHWIRAHPLLTKSFDDVAYEAEALMCK